MSQRAVIPIQSAFHIKNNTATDTKTKIFSQYLINKSFSSSGLRMDLDLVIFLVFSTSYFLLATSLQFINTFNVK